MQASVPDRIFNQIIRMCGFVACAGFGVLALAVIADILFRNLGIAEFPWMNEVTEYLLTISTFFGAPWLLRMNGHVNVDVLLQAVPRRMLPLFNLLANVAGVLICGLMFIYAMRVMIDTRAMGSMVFKVLSFPEWYLQVPMVVCFGLCTLEFLGRFFKRQVVA